MRRARVVHCALVVVLSVVLGACGGEDPATPIRTIEPQNTASSPSPRAETTKKSEGCQLLTAKERESLAGQKLEIVAPVPLIKGALICRWVESLKKPETTSIRVYSQPLQVWVQGLPRQIDRLIGTGRPAGKYSKRLQTAKKEILRGPERISDKQACGYFALLVKINGGKGNATEGMLVQGKSGGGYKVIWERCAGGVHTELVYEEPGLQVSLALGQSVIRLGKIAHRRAVKIL